MSKSILTLDEINLLINSEEPKNKDVYGNLYEILLQIKKLKEISIEELVNNYNLNKTGKAALTYNKRTLLDNVKGEWYVESDSSEDIDKRVRCGLCNTPNKYLFFIRNRINNKRLNVGSFCMTKFPGIDGYTEFKYHLNKTVKNQKVIMRRTEFYNKFPNVIEIIDSANFYFDNLPILLPYNLYYWLKSTVTNLRLIYFQYINYGTKPFLSDKSSMELFSEYIDKFNKLKKQSDEFVSKYRNNPLVCKRDEIDWMINSKQTKLLDEIARNGGLYTQQTVGKIAANSFIKKHLQMFCDHNNSPNAQLNDLKNNESQFIFSLNKDGYIFLYKISVKKFMEQIGANCIVDLKFKYTEYDLFNVSQILNMNSNLQNATDSIADILSKFGYSFILDDNTNCIYIYKRSDKSVKEYSNDQFLKIYDKCFIQKSMDIYKFISMLTAKNWITYELQREQGIEGKIGKLYYQQHIEPFL